MKQFFSIELKHQFNNGRADNLQILPDQSSLVFLQNNRLLFRGPTGTLDCYIEDDEKIKNEIDDLFFWVVCLDEAFFSYTDFPKHFNFQLPELYWVNSHDTSLLEQRELRIGDQLQPPKNAIGLVSISIQEIIDYKTFFIEFNTKKTLWEYHIKVKESMKDFLFSIKDKQDEWTFDSISNNGEGDIVFQSKQSIAFFEKSADRLELSWSKSENTGNENIEKMVLPFANSRYINKNENGKKVTPIYIYL